MQRLFPQIILLSRILQKTLIEKYLKLLNPMKDTFFRNICLEAEIKEKFHQGERQFSPLSPVILLLKDEIEVINITVT